MNVKQLIYVSTTAVVLPSGNMFLFVICEACFFSANGRIRFVFEPVARLGRVFELCKRAQPMSLHSYNVPSRTGFQKLLEFETFFIQ